MYKPKNSTTKKIQKNSKKSMAFVKGDTAVSFLAE
jgi:hypothetical protein